MDFIIFSYIHPFANPIGVNDTIIVLIGKGKACVASFLFFKYKERIFHLLDCFRHLKPKLIQPVLADHIPVKYQRGIGFTDHRRPGI